MRLSVFTCILLLSLHCARAETAGTLEDLFQQVQQERISAKKEIVERENQFRLAHDRQRQLLQEASTELASEKKRGNELKALYEQNQLALEQQANTLAEHMGSLIRLHDIVTQLTNDIDVVLDASLVSAQIPGRDEFIDQLAASKTLPAINDLEQLWRVVLEEISESGKIVTFTTNVINNAGKEVKKNVIRVGVFNAVADGRFLFYNAESKKLQEPARQPAGVHQSLAKDLETGGDSTIAFPIDPTRGVLLSLLIQSPDLIARIHQAGIVGYIIITLGLFALGVVVERFIKLFGMRRIVLSQRHGTTISLDSPLGRLRQVEFDSPRADAETLGLKLDQAIMKEIPKLRKRLPMLAVFATAAPLLGLLGTVAGMIETFQSMMLFGAGDPKIVSGGISLALVATELGLVVAIPILLLHGWLHGVSNQIIHMLEEEIAVIVARREEQIHGAEVKNV